MAKGKVFRNSLSSSIGAAIYSFLSAHYWNADECLVCASYKVVAPLADLALSL